MINRSFNHDSQPYTISFLHNELASVGLAERSVTQQALAFSPFIKLHQQMTRLLH